MTPPRLPKPNINQALLTRAQLTNARRVSREIAIALQRLNQLQLFTRLRQRGLSASESASLVGSSPVTLWRFARQFAAQGWSGLVPQTAKCGRKPHPRSHRI